MPKLDIPFLVGQDESWDKKVLPVGPMRAVRNMKLEHNAELVRRKQAFKKSIEEVDYTVTGYGRPNQIVQSRPNGKDTVGRFDGHSPSYTLTDSKGKLPILSSSSMKTQGVGSSEAYGDQLSPQAVLGSDGYVYTLCIVEKKGTGYNGGSDVDFPRSNAISQPLLERRDPTNMMVLDSGLLRSGVEDPVGSSFASTTRLKLVSNLKNKSIGIATAQPHPDGTSGNWGGFQYQEYKLEGLFDRLDTTAPVRFQEDPTLESSNFITLALFGSPNSFYAAVYGLDAEYDPVSGDVYLVGAYSRSRYVNSTTTGYESKLLVWKVDTDKFSQEVISERRAEAESQFALSRYTACSLSLSPTRIGLSFQRMVRFPATSATTFFSTLDREGEEASTDVTLSSATGGFNILSGLFVSWSAPVGRFSVGEAFSEREVLDRFSEDIRYAQPAINYYTFDTEGALTGSLRFSYGRILTKPIHGSEYSLFACEYGDLQDSDADSFQFIASSYDSKFSPVPPEVFSEGGLGSLGPDNKTLQGSTLYKYLAYKGSFGPQIDPRTNPPAPLTYEVASKKYTVFPVTTVLQGQISVQWKALEQGEKRGFAVREGETLYTGSTITVFDGNESFPCGFLTPPVSFNPGPVPTDTPGTEIVTQFFAAVATVRDANGRLFESIPDIKQFFVSVDRDEDGKVTGGQRQRFDVGLTAGLPNLVKMQLYATLPGDENSLLRLFSTEAIIRGTTPDLTQVIVPIMDMDLNAPAIYTSGGVVNNDPPPAANFIVRTRDRVWASGLSGKSSRIQASKFIREGFGIEWSSLDQFFLDFPEDVVGMGVMDTQVIVLTRHGIFQAGGIGPDNLGVGFFNSPQTLPGRVGCKSRESIVTARDGVYFLSDRGIEKINRGFAAPTWDGESVRDTIEEYPICTGAAYLSTDDTIRWCFSKEAGFGSETVVIVKDLQYGTWYVNQYLQSGNARNMIGVHEDDDGTEHFMFGRYDGLLSDQYREDLKVECSDNNFFRVETGDIRVGGINGWGLGKKLHILGEYAGPAKLKVEMAFNEQEFGKWEKTWDLTDEKYSEGEQLEMRISLPVIRFSNCKFRLSWTCEPRRNSFIANGISLYYSENTTGGVRTQARNQG